MTSEGYSDILLKSFEVKMEKGESFICHVQIQCKHLQCDIWPSYGGGFLWVKTVPRFLNSTALQHVSSTLLKIEFY